VPSCRGGTHVSSFGTAHILNPSSGTHVSSELSKLKGLEVGLHTGSIKDGSVGGHDKGVVPRVILTACQANLYITNIHLQVLMFNSCCDTHISSEKIAESQSSIRNSQQSKIPVDSKSNSRTIPAEF